MPAPPLAPPLREMLLGVAAESIRCGLEGVRYVPRAEEYPLPLRSRRACFVTIEFERRLRGCIGSIEAVRTLVEDVAHNAHAAAFDDPRFGPLTAPEYARLDIYISILSPAQPMRFASEAQLLAQLRPHVDGLVLEDGRHRGTFLPSVWQQLPAPAEFWRQLKRKAGLPEDYWSGTLAVSRYTVESLP